MSQFISHSEWEHQFTEEALTVEELLSSGDFLLLEQSKLRIALDNKILPWDKFKTWITEKTECACLKAQLGPIEIEVLKNKYKENKKTFAHYDIWSNDLIPLETWDNSLIVLGLYPPENMITVPNCIFVLCSPEILNAVIDPQTTEQSDDLHLEDLSKSTELLELDPSVSLPASLNFSKLNISTQTQTQTKTENTETAYSIWKAIDSNHNTSIALARKQFDAYVVLKIDDTETRVYKMDEDLEKEDINPSLFLYKLNLDNVFSKVFKTGKTESFQLEKLGLSILDFKYACITPLKLADKTLGFLVGFKVDKMTEQDENALELISNQNVA